MNLCWIIVHIILGLHAWATIENNGYHNPLAFPTYPLAIIAHFPHELGIDASSVIFKVTEEFLRKDLGR